MLHSSAFWGAFAGAVVGLLLMGALLAAVAVYSRRWVHRYRMEEAAAEAKTATAAETPGPTDVPTTRVELADDDDAEALAAAMAPAPGWAHQAEGLHLPARHGSQSPVPDRPAQLRQMTVSSRVLELWERLASESAPGSGEGPPSRVLDEARLECVTTPRGLVAWNWTPRNLRRLAFRCGVDYYAAVSSAGAVLMAARSAEPLPTAPPGWSHPYPNLWIIREPGRLEHARLIRAYLEKAP